MRLPGSGDPYWRDRRTWRLGALAGVALLLVVGLLLTEPELDVDLGSMGRGWITAERSALFIAFVVLGLDRLSAVKQHKFDTVAVGRDLLQSDDARNARKEAYDGFDTRADPTQRASDYFRGADETAQRMNTLAFMVKHRLVRKALVFENWAPQIVKSWKATEAVTMFRRNQPHDDPDLFASFEDLAKEADAWLQARRSLTGSSASSPGHETLG